MKPCPKCYDPELAENRGYYSYDENHSTFCDLCCAHDQGWWLLLDYYGAKNGLWCCRAGCGHTITADEYLALQGLDPETRERRSRPSGLAERAAQPPAAIL